MRKNLTKKEILRRKKDINRLFSRTDSAVSRFQMEGLRLFIIPNGTENHRAFFSPVKRLGNAVDRNRTKRLLREIYRKHKPQTLDFNLNQGYDWGFVAYHQANGLSYAIRETQYMALLEKVQKSIYKTTYRLTPTGT